MYDFLHFKRTDARAITPHREHPLDAGLDLFALEEVNVAPGQIVKVRTGIHIALRPGEIGVYWEKSGRAWNMKEDRPVGLQMIGGCIDSPYRGELIVILTNGNLFNSLRVLELLAKSDSNKLQLNLALEARMWDHIKIPYGKACIQFLIFGPNGPRFPVPKELPPEVFDREYGQTDRGEKGFASSDMTLEESIPHAPNQIAEALETLVPGFTVGHAPSFEGLVPGPKGLELAPIKTDTDKEVMVPVEELTKFKALQDPTEKLKVKIEELKVRYTQGFDEPSKMEVVEFIDGPLKGTTKALVPKDVIYEQGHRYIRVEGTTSHYRLDPGPSSSVATLLSPVSEFSGGRTGKPQ